MSSAFIPIRYIAIDDSPLDLLAIEEYMRPYPFFLNCGYFSNALEGYGAQQYVKPDLIFLDIEMPEINGMDLLRKVRNEVPMIVVVTSHPEFALEGFELSVLDYILKPLTESRMKDTVRRVQEYWAMKQKAEAYEVLLEEDTLVIKEGYNQVKLAQSDIIYIEAMQDYTKIVTAKKNYVTLSSITFFMERLSPERFLRVHRSYAVAVSQIQELRQTEIICQNASIPVGKTYRSSVSRLKI
ncbi:DNA-binding response regulator [Dyadobacter frigoris]|uniref:LytR/AlgR family response regulator transcription factor n=1 Tax=Dyadobacter frigoris TaxID=2576211 RepID=UPI0024A44FFE|nr:LytTR family DNA-binding domain-containing protein [Dyadobacter frigoris]GLU51485.1 DNA-binding response regulator [Dyadobacter frigoris]